MLSTTIEVPSTDDGIGTPGEIEQGGHDVLPTDESIVDAVVTDSVVVCGADEDHRDLCRVLVVESFGPLMMVAEHIPVIGREEDDRVVEQTFFAKGTEDDA